MKNEMIKGVLINVTTGTAEVAELENNPISYAQKLNCLHVNIVTRKIDGYEYGVIFNKEIDTDAIPSATAPGGSVEFYGNIFLVKQGLAGVESLSVGEINRVLRHVYCVVADTKIKVLLKLDARAPLNWDEWEKKMCEELGADWKNGGELAEDIGLEILLNHPQRKLCWMRDNTMGDLIYHVAMIGL